MTTLEDLSTGILMKFFQNICFSGRHTVNVVMSQMCHIVQLFFFFLAFKAEDWGFFINFQFSFLLFFFLAVERRGYTNIIFLRQRLNKQTNP